MRLLDCTTSRSPNLAEARRFRLTLEMLRGAMPPPARVLDLGAPNRLSALMAREGYQVQNTRVDLDEEPEAVAAPGVEAVTAFEILEHLVGPLQVLRQIEAPRLFATVPLRLWFASAYRNPDDPWDRHFHEFEDWQFDWLLEKAGWRVVQRAKWTSPSRAIGLRPLLRRFTPRWYAVEAVRLDRQADS